MLVNATGRDLYNQKEGENPAIRDLCQPECHPKKEWLFWETLSTKRTRGGFFGGSTERRVEESVESQVNEFKHVVDRLSNTSKKRMQLIDKVTTKIEINFAVQDLRWHVGYINNRLREWSEFSIKAIMQLINE